MELNTEENVARFAEALKTYDVYHKGLADPYGSWSGQLVDFVWGEHFELTPAHAFQAWADETFCERIVQPDGQFVDFRHLSEEAFADFERLAQSACLRFRAERSGWVATHVLTECGTPVFRWEDPHPEDDSVTQVQYYVDFDWYSFDAPSAVEDAEGNFVDRLGNLIDGTVEPLGAAK